MTIPLVDLRRDPELLEAISVAMNRVLYSGRYASGEEVPAFEKEWAAYCGAKYAVGVSSGSDALYLCLRYAKTMDVSHAATTPVSFWATTEAALRARMIVDFSDISATGIMASPVIRDDTINLPVALYGMPIPTRGPWAKALRIEDCAQSHGHKWPVDGTGLLARCYSFYPTKNLGAMGMAGAVVTNDKTLYDWLRMMRTHGEEGGRFIHVQASGNWRMDELQAAVLRAKLPFLDQWTARRRAIAKRYYEALLDWSQALRLPVWSDEHVWHIFPVFAAPSDLGVENAVALSNWLKNHDIEVGLRYPLPLHLQPGASFMEHKTGDFPESERWCKEVINLPIFPEMRDDEVDQVLAAVREWSGGVK